MSDGMKTIIKSFTYTVKVSFHPTHDIREEDLDNCGYATCRKCFLTNDPFESTPDFYSEGTPVAGVFDEPCRGVNRG